MLFVLPLICFSQQQPEQIVKQYVSLLDNFLMSPNSSKRADFENSKLIEGCLFNDEIYVIYKKDSHIVDCKAKDYAGILADAINASRGHTYANVKIARNLSNLNNGGKYEVTAYLQYTGAIEMRTVTVFHIKNGKIFALTNDFIKTKEWNSGSIEPDDPEGQQTTSSGGSSTTTISITVGGRTYGNMIFVQGGTFSMGATSEQGSEADSDEEPVHAVSVGDFYIGETEVTQGLWKAVMGSNPSDESRGIGDNLPVNYVSWNDCQEFIKKLNQQTGKTFRLPTEAEWEYAARGGNKRRGYKYSGSNNVGDVAWYDGNSNSKVHPVKSKTQNELGLYDMSGNVWEWCQDCWDGSANYNTTPRDGSANSSGSGRVLRGGSWYNYARYCRSSNRDDYNPSYRIFINGLRLALVP